MKRIFGKQRGSSMLLAICIFLILAVLGINVLAASYSGVQNMKSKYNTEQTLQYLNSIYEIVDKKICQGEFKLNGLWKAEKVGQKISETTPVNLTIGNGKTVEAYVEFYATEASNELKAKVYMKQDNVVYNITSVYTYNGSASFGGTYALKCCEGVSSYEE